MVTGIIFGQQANRFGLHAQINILGYQNNLSVFVLVGDDIGEIKDVVILLEWIEVLFNLGSHLLIKTETDFAQTGTNRDPTIKDGISAEFIQGPDKLSRMIVDDLVAAFEIVEFFKYRNRNNNIVVGKMA